MFTTFILSVSCFVGQRFHLSIYLPGYTDCGKNDPETYDEMKKDIVALMTEEVNLQVNVTTDALQRTNTQIMGAKRASLHFQKEADKCIVGVETCEEARERAEVALIEQRKLTALWISRAREHGWGDGEMR